MPQTSGRTHHVPGTTVGFGYIAEENRDTASGSRNLQSSKRQNETTEIIFMAEINVVSEREKRE
jgi:hypothetical protein